MKKIFTIFLASLFAAISFGQTYHYVVKDTVIQGWNSRLAYVPNYPDSVEMFISFYGAGEVGTDTTKLGVGTWAYWMQHGFSGVVPMGNGPHYPVYASLQIPTTSASAVQNPAIIARVQALLSRFPVKARALFADGYSNGGRRALELASYRSVPGGDVFGKNIVAILGNQSEKPNDIFDATSFYPQNMVDMAKAGVKLLAVDQYLDGGRDMANYTKRMNDTVPGSVVYLVTQIGSGGHCCFTVPYDSAQNWNSSNTNIRSKPYGNYPNSNAAVWMFRQGDTAIKVLGHTPPTVSAGNDQTIQQPASTTSVTGSETLNGDATSFTSKQWTQQSGPHMVTFGTPTTNTSTVSGLTIIGSYVLTYTVTDNNGNSSSDNVTINVTSSANIPPVADAGNDGTQTQPNDSTVLDGSGSHAVQTVLTAWHWRLISGNTGTLLTPDQSVCKVTGLSVGTTLFEITVTDANGLVAKDTTSRTVFSNNIGNEQDVWIYLDSGVNTFSDPAWNEWSIKSNTQTGFLKSTTGDLTTIKISRPGISNVLDNGSTYGNGQTLSPGWPQGVYRYCYYVTAGPAKFVISGLDPTQKYTLQLLNTRVSSTSIDTAYTVTANKTPVSVGNNWVVIPSFTNQSSDGTGVLNFFLNKTAGSSIYLSGIKLRRQGSAVNTPIVLLGSWTDIDYPDDSLDVSTVSWSLLSGPPANVVIQNPTALSTQATGMDSVGDYLFLLRGCDTRGACSVDTVRKTITSLTGSVTGSAGRDTTIARQQVSGWTENNIYDSTYFNAIVTGSPNISSAVWTKEIGGNAVIVNGTTLTPKFTNLDTGDYLFKVKLKNSTDSGYAYKHIRVVDWQQRNVTASRVGPGVRHILNATSTTDLVKNNLAITEAANGNPIMAGDTIVIMPNLANGGIYKTLRIGGFGGNKLKHVKVILGGPVRVEGNIGFGWGINDSSTVCYADFDFTLPGITYGLVNQPASPTNNIGLGLNNVTDCSFKGFALDNVSTGILVKNNQNAALQTTLFNAFRFKNIEISYFRISNTTGEAIYCGNTSLDGHSGITSFAPSTRQDSVNIHHGIIIRCGFDAIQVVNSVYALIHDNIILYPATTNASSQNYAIILGANTQGNIYNNYIRGAKNGIAFSPFGHSEMYNNVIDSNFNGQTGGNRSYAETGHPDNGSDTRENRDTADIWIWGNVFTNGDTASANIYTLSGYVSLIKPNKIYNNYVVDATRSLPQMLLNYNTGIQVTTGNTLFPQSALTSSVNDLSSISNGPVVQVTLNGIGRAFTDAVSIVQYYKDALTGQLLPPPNGGALKHRKGGNMKNL